MAGGTLTIDLAALAANYAALHAKSSDAVETAAVVKANGYGLDAGTVARTLAQAGATWFFVAIAEEGVAVRAALGLDATICVFSGHMDGDTALLADHNLIPMLNDPAQLDRHMATLPDHRFGIQLDTGMNRLGFEADQWDATRDRVMAANPILVMSHLACADEPDHPLNREQLANFHAMTDGFDVRRSLAATGGTLLGPDYHFDMTRPGIGLYGGAPFVDAKPVAYLSVPIIQTRIVHPGEGVGYGKFWIADKRSVIATISAGYADGLIRAQSGRGFLFDDQTACPIIGRVSMDMIGVDVTHLPDIPAALDMLCTAQGVDAVADAAGTIGYEILTSLGARYNRIYQP